MKVRELVDILNGYLEKDPDAKLSVHLCAHFENPEEMTFFDKRSIGLYTAEKPIVKYFESYASTYPGVVFLGWEYKKGPIGFDFGCCLGGMMKDRADCKCAEARRKRIAQLKEGWAVDED